MGFGPPEGDAEVDAALASARGRQAMTFALPGTQGSYALQPVTQDPFVHQELDRDLLPHALGDGARLLRTSRTGAGCGAI